MTAPVSYVDGFVFDPTGAHDVLRDQLEWERRGDTPRHEYYSNTVPDPYVYGAGRGRRLYMPRRWHPLMLEIKAALESHVGAAFEACFLNRYDDGSDHLGWHADDSPELDDARPIAIVSLGAEREIWFRPKPAAFVEAAHERRDGFERRFMERPTQPRRVESTLPVEKLALRSGSLCVMAAGMQREWQHRIPKAPRTCASRISLTFRGYRGPAVSTTAHAA